MGDVLVRQATISDGKIESLTVAMHGLPERTIDRETVLSWMRDGHSLIPVRGRERLTALQLVEVGEREWSIRHDNQPIEQDQVPDLDGGR